MNILITNFSEITSPGGVHKTIREIAMHVSKKGHRVTVLQANEFGLSNEENYEGFRIIRIKTKLGNKLYGFHPELYSFFRKNLKNLKPDVIHIHGYHTLYSPEIIFLSTFFQPGIPLFFSPHFGIFSHSTFAGKYLRIPYNKLVGRKIFKPCRKVIAASNFEANNLHSILNVPRSDIVIIPHGVDFVDLSNRAKNDGIIKLLYAGYLLKLKGVHYIIRALCELIYSNGINAQLTIVGNGPHEFDLKKLAENLNVNNFIKWIDLQSSHDLVKFYKEADIFLLTSESENYGIVVGEALAFGTPVIVSKIPALTEFLNEPGCFGIDYPPEPRRLAQLILDVYRDNLQIGPFSNRIRTWDKVSSDYISAYSEEVKKIKESSYP